MLKSFPNKKIKKNQVLLRNLPFHHFQNSKRRNLQKKNKREALENVSNIKLKKNEVS